MTEMNSYSPAGGEGNEGRSERGPRIAEGETEARQIQNKGKRKMASKFIFGAVDEA